MNIGLIGCSATKLGEDTPEKKFRAQDIYIGNSFKISKNIGLKKFNCDDWAILSAEHKLLDKNAEIVYYDRYLPKQTPAYKKEWIKTVLKQLNENYDLQNDVFYIFAGSDYYRRLIPHLHCFVFGYKNSNTIDLDNITEYCYGKRLYKNDGDKEND